MRRLGEMEVGGAYFVIAHAYLHYIVKVAALVPKGISPSKIVQVHSSSRDWTEFFKTGIVKGQDNWDVLQPGGFIPVGNLPWFPWDHEIPSEKSR